MSETPFKAQTNNPWISDHSKPPPVTVNKRGLDVPSIEQIAREQENPDMIILPTELRIDQRSRVHLPNGLDKRILERGTAVVGIDVCIEAI